MSYKDGNKYSGDFREGKRHGFGVETGKDGEIRFKGTWKKDKFEDGRGSLLTWDDYGQGTYKGEMKAGLPHGTGKMLYQGGHFYEGQWKFGLHQGRGIM